MLVEDTTAFIEQLEIQRQDRRAEKLRRKRAHAELAVLRAEWEARVAREAVRKLEDELAALPEPAAVSPGRRLLEARRRRSLEHRLGSMHALARSRAEETAFARDRLCRLDRNGADDRSDRGARLFRLHSAEHHLECSARRFARLARSQLDEPVLVARKNGRSWWWYADRFWWDDHGLRAREVKALVLDRELSAAQQVQRLAEARATLLHEARPLADSTVSQVVRFAVWCRDRGRCVDCGIAEDVGFDEILPLDAGGPQVAANVELRCQGCREQRALNEARARVARAQVAAVHDL